MLSLVSVGIAWGDALDMTPLESDKIVSIHNARQIPPENRMSGGVALSAREEVLAALRG